MVKYLPSKQMLSVRFRQFAPIDFAELAQQVEFLICNEEVVRSIRTFSTNFNFQKEIMSDPTNPSIFTPNPGSDPTNSVPSKDNATTDAELTDLLSGIKNERGEPKYKTLKDAIIGLQHAQTYIPELKGNLTAKEQQLADALAKAAKVEELERTVRDLTERGSPNGSPPAGLTEQDIAKIVKQSLDTTLTAREQEQIQSKNIDTVVNSVKQAFGAEAEKKFYEKATELGMTVAEFNTLAAKSPKMVLSALGITEKPANPQHSPSQSTINSQAFTPRSDTLIGRNTKSTLVGATSEEQLQESRNAAKMVEELEAAGLSVHDLSNPQVYKKYFGK